MLIDTNVLSELMRPRPATRVLAWASGLLSVHLSVITLEEVHFGLALKLSPRLEAWLERFLGEHATVLPVTPAIAHRCGKMRAQLRLRGKQRTQADLLIAATAVEHSLRLATRNTRDFEGLGLDLVDPFKT